MRDLRELTETDVRAWTDPRSFARGERYYRDGRVLNPRRQGSLLRARCRGSRPDPYRTEVLLGTSGILAADCSCPVGAGGHCKHAVALLLTWVREPHAFAVVEELEVALGRRSRGELIALIRRIVARYPDLESLLELPVVEEGDRPPAGANAEIIRRHAQDAFASGPYDGWDDAYDAARQLCLLVDIGDDYAELKRWRDAETVYRAVMKETLEGYRLVRDQSGYLHDVVDRCVDGLAACLRAAEDPTRRRTLLKALFGVYRWNLDMGGIDMGPRAPQIILQHATTDERRLVAEWLRDALPEDGLWARPTGGAFLLLLEEEWLGDEAYLRICRETGLHRELVQRLLALGRLDEARAAVLQAPLYYVPDLADLLVAHGSATTAEELVRSRAAATEDSRLLEWLKKRALETGDAEEALNLTEKLFWQRPGLAGYRELRKVAGLTGRWTEFRRDLLARLAAEGYRLRLIDVFLDDGEVDRAIEILDRMRGTPHWRQVSDGLIALVARAAEQERPKDAIRLYTEAAERLIARRGRGNYSEAAQHLTRVRAIYWGRNQQRSWAALIARLREENRRLPALRDELEKAGL